MATREIDYQSSRPLLPSLITYRGRFDAVLFILLNHCSANKFDLIRHNEELKHPEALYSRNASCRWWRKFASFIHRESSSNYSLLACKLSDPNILMFSIIFQSLIRLFYMQRPAIFRERNQRNCHGRRGIYVYRSHVFVVLS